MQDIKMTENLNWKTSLSINVKFLLLKKDVLWQESYLCAQFSWNSRVDI